MTAMGSRKVWQTDCFLKAYAETQKLCEPGTGSEILFLSVFCSRLLKYGIGFFQQAFIDHFLVEMYLKIHENIVKVLKHFSFSNQYTAFLQSEFKRYTPFLASLSSITN